MASYTGGSEAKGRVHALETERKKQQQEVERRKRQITSETSNALSQTASKFSSRTETVEDLLKSDTVGLVRHEDYKARREYLQRCAAEEKEKRDAAQRDRDAESRRQRLQKANKAKLSFADDDDSDSSGESDSERSPATKRKVSSVTTVKEETAIPTKEEPEPIEAAQKRRRLGTNPDADTVFLPDRERELEEQAERERLKQQWLNEQETIKNETIRVTYSYWDGIGHRKVIKCRKGTTVGRFLAMVQIQFKELRNTSADSLMFIKEDLIIPHHYSFYDFIVTKARGVSILYSRLIESCYMIQKLEADHFPALTFFVFPLIASLTEKRSAVQF